jgi:hypothetical protein
MYKKFLFLVILLLPIISWGQTESKDNSAKGNDRYFLEGSVGVSVPFGEYMKSDPRDEHAGFATTGFLGQLTFNWHGKMPVGAAIQYTYQRNPLLASVQDDTLPGRVFPLGTGNWSNHYLMVGPAFFKQIQKFSIDVKVLGGIVFAFSPVFYYTSPDSTLSTVKNYGSGFSYEVAAGLGYSISKNLDLRFTLSYLGATATLRKQFGGDFLGYTQRYDETTGTWIIEPVYSPVVTLDLKNYINTFNATFGVVVKL